MKKITTTLLFLLFYCSYLFSQQFHFAWLSDTHVGAPNGYESLQKIVADINKKTFDFVLLSGDITESGTDKDLDRAKNVLDSLKIKYYIVPGNHDVKWSESCCTKYASLWGEDRFNFVYNGIRFIGFSTTIWMRNHGGHIAPETLDWIEQTLKKVNKNEPVIFVMHHLLDNELDNWFDLTNRIRNHNVVALLCGHGHTNKNTTINGAPALMARSTYGKDNLWGYNSIVVTKDSLEVFEEKGDGSTKKLGIVSRLKRNIIPKVDSVQFINYNAKVLANINLNKTLTYGLFANENYIATASKEGTVFCFNSKGKALWIYETKKTILSRPVIINNTLIVGTVQGDLITMDCKTGKVIKSIKINDKISSQLGTGKVKLDGATTDAVFVGTSYGAFYCFDVKTLKQIWKNSDAQNLVEDEPLILNDKIIYGSWDTYLYNCDLNNGNLIWRWRENDRFYYAPAACKPATDGENIFVATPDRFVSAVNISTGKTSWRTNKANGWESIGISNDKKNVLVKGFADKFWYLSASDGTVLDSVLYSDPIETMGSEVIEADGKVMFTTREGMLYAIDKEHKIEPVMFLGNTKGHAVKVIKENTYAVSAMDGRIVVFSFADKKK